MPTTSTIYTQIRTTLNTYDELCLNCFIVTNDIQAFERKDYLASHREYASNHKAIMFVDEGFDSYETYPDDITSIPYNRKDRRVYSESVEFHTAISIRPCGDHLDLKVCKGRGSMLCENCRFRKV